MHCLRSVLVFDRWASRTAGTIVWTTCSKGSSSTGPTRHGLSGRLWVGGWRLVTGDFTRQPTNQPTNQPSQPVLCTGLRSPPGRRFSIEYSKSTALRSIEPASRGPGDRCCPRRRSEGVSQQLQDLKRPRNRQQFQWPSQTAAKSASILVKRISPARFRNGLVTGNGEPVRHRLTENSESIQTRFQLLEKPAP